MIAALKSVSALIASLTLLGLAPTAWAQQSVHDRAVTADTAKDYVTARRLYEESCSAGFAQSCREMVVFALEGRGGPKDAVAARNYAEKACRGGSGDGCGLLAQFSHEGTGGPKGYVFVRELAKHFCGPGGTTTRLCYYYGLALRDGLGGDVDYEGAEQALLIPCRGSRPVGCFELGRMVFQQASSDEERNRGATLMAHACYRGYEPACTMIGLDVATARQTLTESCDAGDKVSCQIMAKP